MSSKRLRLTTYTDNVKLIEEVRKHPHLWDPEDRKVSSHNSVYTWKENSQKLEVPVLQCKIKWKNYRDTLRRLMKIDKMNPHHSRAKKWRYYPHMKFMANIINFPDTTPEDDEPYLDDRQDDTESNMIFKVEELPDDSGEQETEIMIEAPNFEMADDFDKLDTNCRVDTEADDFNAMFLKSLLPFFRQLDPMRNLRARNKIQEILMNELNAQQMHKFK